MRRRLFNRVYDDIKDKHWWQQGPSATGQLQAHPLIKSVAALRVLLYGDGQDRMDKCHGLSKTTVHNAVTRLIPILEKHQAFHLRPPTVEDLNRIMRRSAERGLPGCIGSLDYSHWRWTKCPGQLKGMYWKSGRGRQRAIVLETGFGEDMWVWSILGKSSHCQGDPGAVATPSSATEATSTLVLQIAWRRTSPFISATYCNIAQKPFTVKRGARLHLMLRILCPRFFMYCTASQTPHAHQHSSHTGHCDSDSRIGQSGRATDDGGPTCRFSRPHTQWSRSSSFK